MGILVMIFFGETIHDYTPLKWIFLFVGEFKGMKLKYYIYGC